MESRQSVSRFICSAVGALVAVFMVCCVAVVPAHSSDSLVGDAPRSGADIEGPKTSPPPGFNVAAGPGYLWNRQIGSAYSHWLGALDAGNGTLEYCVNLDSLSPTGPGDLVTSPKPSPAPGVLGDLTVSNAQMGYIFKTYGGINDATTRAALSFLTHANYEQGGGVNHVQQLIFDVMDSSDPSIRTKAKSMVAAAKKSGVQNVIPGEVVVSSNKMDFELVGLGVKDGSGNWIDGVGFTVTIDKGDAVFSNGKKSISLTSATKPLTVRGSSTGTGAVEVSYKFHWDEASVSLRERFGSQTTLVPGKDVPKTATGKYTTFDLIFDFQPILTSNTGQFHLLASDAQVAKDFLDVKADSSYVNPAWTEIDGKPVPVRFDGTLYYLGSRPAAGITNQVPDTAQVIGTTSFVAQGEGRYEAAIDLSKDLPPGALYWQWNMSKDAQGQWAKYVHADWSDQFGLEAEHSYKPYVAQLDTSISARLTKNGLYMLDDIFIDGLPEDHPSFTGGAGYGPDNGVITQLGLFFEGKRKGEVVEEDREGAVEVCTVEIEAKNGYLTNVGGTKCKWPQDEGGNEIPGVFAWSHSYDGSDRVEAFRTSVTDVTEQHEVVPENYSIITKAQKEVLLGETATDTAVVTGKVPANTKLAFTAYKEAYDENGLPKCTVENQIGQVEYGVISDAGEYTSPPLKITQEDLEAAGSSVKKIWWVENTFDPATGKVVLAGQCGLPNETTKVIPYDPQISTKAQSNGSLEVGVKIRDTLEASWSLPEGFTSTQAPSITPWPFPTGSRTEVALYYAAPGEELVCNEEQLVGSDFIDLVEGKTQYETKYWQTHQPGTFGFVETTRPPTSPECPEGENGEPGEGCEEEIISQGVCGDPDETLTIELAVTPPEPLAKTGGEVTAGLTIMTLLGASGAILIARARRDHSGTTPAWKSPK